MSLLKFVPTRSYSAKPSVRMPTENPDVVEEGEFTVRFRHVDKARYTEILDKLQSFGTRGRFSDRDVQAFKDEVLAQFSQADQARIAERLDALIPLGQAAVSEIVAFKTAVLDEVVSSVDLANESGALYDPATARAFVLGDLLLTNATFDSFLATHAGAPAKNSKPSRKP